MIINQLYNSIQINYIIRYKPIKFSINVGSSINLICCGDAASKTAKDQAISNHSDADTQNGSDCSVKLYYKNNINAYQRK